MQINPRNLVQQLVQSVEREVLSTANNATLSRAEKNKLSPALQAAADQFMAGKTSVKAQDFIAAVTTAIEHDLAPSLQTGQMLRGDITPRLQGLLERSPLGGQILARLGEQGALSVTDARQDVARALATANPTPRSQIGIYRALNRLVDVMREDGAPRAKIDEVDARVKSRKSAMRDDVNGVVRAKDTAFKASGSNGNKDALRRALQDAFDVYSAVAPRSSRIKTLQKRAAEIGVGLTNDAARVQPFFARFLENQNRAGAPAVEAPGIGTEKFPSDAEDGGADNIGDMVTMKAPSDAEDGGVGDGGGIGTEKFPSDAEDGGAGDDIGDMVTMKAPSDAEDGGVGDGGGVMTEKFPSDAEDGGAGDPGDIVTAKFPSDAEDGGAGDPGVGDPGDLMTEKFPSDNEDGGDGAGAAPPDDAGDIGTEKFPSDNEDGGDGAGAAPPDDMAFMTEKFPSDAEDGG